MRKGIGGAKMKMNPYQNGEQFITMRLENFFKLAKNISQQVVHSMKSLSD